MLVWDFFNNSLGFLVSNLGVNVPSVEKVQERLVKVTPLKINMEPKNGVLEDDFPFQTGDVQIPC